MNSKILKIVLTVFTLLFLIWLPYYIFDGKLFIGGDDTRLMYVYPYEYLKYISLFSWTHISSVGLFAPNHHGVPFLVLLSMIETLIKSKTVIDYFIFSLPLIFGFLYFKLLIKEIWEECDFTDAYFGSLFYTLSPILIINQLSVFLYSAWLIALIPIFFYYFIRYLKTGRFYYVYLNILWTIIFSLGLYSIPWSFAFIPTLCLCLFLGFFLYNKKEYLVMLKRLTIFIGLIILVHLFWLIPFISTFLIKGGTNIGSTVLSSVVSNTFRSSVVTTSTGNTLYPLLNLFHRRIAFDFDWQLKNAFLNFYDHMYWVNSIYVVVIFASLFMYKSIKGKNDKKIYLMGLFAFLISLFFFTVNIGPFKELFFVLGNIPGFVMFRNFYDKFAFAYVFFYSIFFTISLGIISKKTTVIKRTILLFLILATFINILPIKNIVNSPLWTTKTSLRSIVIPQEYLSFISQVKKTVDPTTTILSLPLNIASYSIIKEDGSENVYAGTSPLKILTGINDLSGNMSFNTFDTGKVDEYINTRDYENLNKMIEKYNINYILLTKNIPTQVKNSYLFGNGYKLEIQDDKFLSAITTQRIAQSSQGNYELYTSKVKHILIESPNITIKKISPVHYKLVIHKLSNNQKVIFNDSYHPGWRLYGENYSILCSKPSVENKNMKECQPEDTNINLFDLSYLLKASLFENSHIVHNDFSNEWTINNQEIKNYIHSNKDGSIDITLSLYFLPQLSFYIGIILSIISFIILSIYTGYTLLKHHAKK